MTSIRSMTTTGSVRCGHFLVAALLAGCTSVNPDIGSSVYLHNAGDKAAIDKAAESLVAARAEHAAAFDGHRTYLATAVADERRAIVAADLMRRDQELVSVLDSQLTVEALATGRLNQIAKGAAADPRILRQASLRASQLPRWVSFKEDSIRTRDRLIDLFQRAGGKSRAYCNDSGVGHLPDSSDGLEIPAAGPARGYYSTLKTTCDEIANHHGEIFQRQQKGSQQVGAFPPAIVAALGGEVDPANLPEGDLRDAYLEAANFRRAVKVQDALAKETAAHLKQLEKYLACVKRVSSAPGSAERISAAAADVAAFIEFIAKLDTQSATMLPAASQPQPEDGEGASDKCVAPAVGAAPKEEVARPPKVDSPGKLVAQAGKGARDAQERDLLTVENIKLLLVNLRGFAPGRSITASLQAEAQEFREEKLNEILTAVATAPAGGEPDSRTALVAASIIRALKHLDAFAEDKYPSTSSVLVDLAAAKLRATNARIEADRLKRLAALANMKLLAVQRELVTLAETRTLAAASTPESGRPLRSYASSWNFGRIQQQAIEAEMRNQAYFSWLERERAATEASYAVLEPAMSELKIYGDGGFRASDIAAYLHAFGLGAVALGE